MIPGHATPDGTRRYAAQFADLTFNSLGSTRLTVSGAGFGGYRVAAGTTPHRLALKRALAGGINLIDTSANYADGGSETLVGRVLAELFDAGTVDREQIVVVTKGGYLQGANFALSQRRKQEGRPFTDLVEVADGLEHCIHPDFLDDQITRSLDRLGLETVDGYLLHNPEYYLDWAHTAGAPLDAARAEYDRRIGAAFAHLEREVARGRIRFYGVSSNSFPAAATNPQFSDLLRMLALAASVAPAPRFALIQFPFNLLEPGAVLEKNQSSGETLLGAAQRMGLGVLINRPLNAIRNGRMHRLADVEVRSRMDYADIIQAIKSLARSETRLWRTILPGVDDIPEGLRFRIKQQGCLAETLKHHWRSFGSYERWRQARDGMFLPRIQGVIDFLAPLAAQHADLRAWLESHPPVLDHALRAVASIYADGAVAQEKKLLSRIATADAVWARPGTLSQKAVRALLSTAGVSTVLVGMRQEAYVDDVRGELARPVEAGDRRASWERLRDGLAEPSAA